MLHLGSSGMFVCAVFYSLSFFLTVTVVRQECAITCCRLSERSEKVQLPRIPVPGCSQVAVCARPVCLCGLRPCSLEELFQASSARDGSRGDGRSGQGEEQPEADGFVRGWSFFALPPWCTWQQALTLSASTSFYRV